MFKALAVGFAILVLGPGYSASANPERVPGCRANLPLSQVFPRLGGTGGVRSGADLKGRLGGRGWGLEHNTSVVFDFLLRKDVLQVRLPKGSINPKHATAPVGGMGWRWRPSFEQAPRRACLRYAVFFPRDFQFQRGGKLPGLFGGNAPAGGRATDGSQGFSARLMWRRGGAGEVYGYIPGHPPKRGQSIGRGSWRFRREVWTEIEQEIVLNRPGYRDGSLRIWVNGELRLERADMVFRTVLDVAISGVMADIFYGGETPSWAAPADTALRITPFELRWTPPGLHGRRSVISN